MLRSFIYTFVFVASVFIVYAIYKNYGNMLGNTNPFSQTEQFVLSPQPLKTIEERLAEREIAKHTVPIDISCNEGNINNTMFLKCTNSENYWGRWEVYLIDENGSLQHIWTTIYNDSTGGGPFTTDPMDLVIVFFHVDGRMKEYLYHTKNSMRDCTVNNLCFRVM